METARTVRECIVLARTNLVRARILKQEAVLAIETAKIYTSVVDPENVYIITKTEMSRYHRRQARKHLKLAERLNGQLYLAGQPTVALTGLTGSKFRYWEQYKAEYKKSPVFMGIDPT